MELEVIIGLEVHAQIKTLSKMFCRCSNDDFDAEPNTVVCPICMGMPGVLPVVNREAVELGMKAALALNCRILPECKFDRKNYFYPDLPNGFQISQFDQPLSEKGFLEIEVPPDPLSPEKPDNSPLQGGATVKKRIGITRLHLENDAGKLTHEGEFSLVDFNRSGSPLMEIVSEPDLRSPTEAKAYAEDLRNVLRAVGASDCDMFKGQMRFDASVSLRPVGDKKLYPRMEIKNLNSFRSLESALEYEINRLTKLWEVGTPPQKEATVGWIDDEQRTQVMREKESAADYRYFPEPDLPPLVTEESFVEKLRLELPELPAAFRKRLVDDFGCSDQEAKTAVAQLNLGRFFEAVARECGDHKKARTFVFSVLLGHLKEELKDVSDSNVVPEHLVELIQSINSGKVSQSVAKEVFEEVYATGKDPLVIIESRGLEQVSDSAELEKICRKVVEQNVNIVNDYKEGKERAFGALVGKVMVATKGQGNPGMINEILKKLIS